MNGSKLTQLLLIAVILLGIGATILYSRNTELSNQLGQEHSFLAAIQDSVTHYKDKAGREVIAKQVIQANLSELTSNYKLLSANQKKLTDNIKLLPKAEQKNLVSATEVKQVIKIEHVTNIDSTHRWHSHTDTLSYSIRATGDTLSIDSLSVPNQLFLTQHRAKNGAITVTARNSNPLIKNADIDSIIIPTKKPSLLLNILLIVAGIATGVAITH
jgi:hypothetical protein